MTANFASWAEGSSPNAVTVRSADGLTAVRLQRTRDGVFVQRELQRKGAARVVQAANFSSADDFRRWCNADLARFEHPHFFARLMRHADDLFSSIDITTGAG